MKKLSAIGVEKSKYKELRSKGGKNPGALLGNRIPDGEYPGLYLFISPHGSKSFRFDFRFPRTAAGARQTLTYGQWPMLTLAEAREKHREAKRDLENGINPAAAKQEARATVLTALENTYEKVSARWYEGEAKGKSDSWKDNGTRWLKITNDAFGAKTLQDITGKDIERAIQPLLDAGNAFSAERVRQQTAKVFAWSKKKRLFTGENPADELRGEIKVPDHKGNAHIKDNEIPEFVAAVENSRADPQTKRAAKLLLYTFVRKQELLAMKRNELDLDSGILEIPAERMKNRIPLLVPLSKPVKELFRAQLASSNGEYVFPSLTRPGKHAGLSTLNVFFDRIGFADRLTPHGLRVVASTKLNGTRRFSGDVIELQLSHREGDRTRATYNKADHLEERAAMMDFWAEFVDGLCAGKTDQNVIQLKPKAA